MPLNGIGSSSLEVPYDAPSHGLGHSLCDLVCYHFVSVRSQHHNGSRAGRTERCSNDRPAGRPGDRARHGANADSRAGPHRSPRLAVQRAQSGPPGLPAHERRAAATRRDGPRGDRYGEPQPDTPRHAADPILRACRRAASLLARNARCPRRSQPDARDVGHRLHAHRSDAATRLG